MAKGFPASWNRLDVWKQPCSKLAPRSGWDAPCPSCQGEKARLRRGLPVLCATPGRLAYHLESAASFHPLPDRLTAMWTAWCLRWEDHSHTTLSWTMVECPDDSYAVWTVPSPSSCIAAALQSHQASFILLCYCIIAQCFHVRSTQQHWSLRRCFVLRSTRLASHVMERPSGGFESNGQIQRGSSWSVLGVILVDWSCCMARNTVMAPFSDSAARAWVLGFEWKPFLRYQNTGIWKPLRLLHLKTYC